MTLLAFLCAFVSSVLNAAATIALREAGQGRCLFTSLPTPIGPLSDWYVAALAFYGGAFIAYAVALKFLSPPVAYPVIVGGAYVLMMAATWAMTRDLPPAQSLVGGAVVLFGVGLIIAAPKA